MLEQPLSVPGPFAGVPQEQLYELFHAAMEVVYTGTVARGVEAARLPALLALAHALEMGAVARWASARVAELAGEEQDAVLEELLGGPGAAELAQEHAGLQRACAAWAASRLAAQPRRAAALRGLLEPILVAHLGGEDTGPAAS